MKGRFVNISQLQYKDIRDRVDEKVHSHNESYGEILRKEIIREENRQIQAGIQHLLEQNMKHNNQTRTINPDTGIVDCTA